MGAKGSKQQLASRFKPADFFFGQSSDIGQPSRVTCMHLITHGRNDEERLLAVGCECGGVMVYGREGVHTRLYEEQAPSQSESNEDEDESSSKPAAPLNSAVVYLTSLPRSMLLSVHASYIKLWSLEAMCEVFTLQLSEVPKSVGPKSSTGPYVITSAAIANEYDSRYCWLGTAQGEVLLFDTVKKRLSAYRVPLLPEVENHASDSGGLGTKQPYAVTALAQLTSDSSQLLIGYSCDIVLTWHISTQKLHRSYKRAQCGGVSALCWESASSHPNAAEHFVVGHKNGMVAVWKRRYHHSPDAVFFISPTPGPRWPVHSVKWSAKTFGFFVSGGHPQVASSDPMETGGAIFVSGAKFERRKLCTQGGEVVAPPKDATASQTQAQPSTAGVKEFVQVLMSKPGQSNLSQQGPAGSPAAKHPAATPVFICLEHTGRVRVHFPTVSPPVPPLPPTALQELALESVCIQSAASEEDAPKLRQALEDLRKVAPQFRPWLSLIRSSLSQQHLWPLTGGLCSTEMHQHEMEEERLFRQMNATTATARTGSQTDASSSSSDQPHPALLLSTHPGDNSIRLSDVTSPFQVDVLCQVGLAKILAEGVKVAASMFCLQRRELIVGTSAGEILLFRLQLVKPPQPQPVVAAETKPADPNTSAANSPANAAPPSASTPPATQPPAASAPDTSSVSSADASASASSSSSALPLTTTATTAATPPIEYGFDLIHRISFSSRPIRTIIYAPETDKYAVIDSGDSFTFLRPENGATLKQTIPSATITAAHFSSEPLIKSTGKSNIPQAAHFLYICASDGSIHVFSSEMEAKLSVIPSISADESRLEVIQFMQTVSFQGQVDAASGVQLPDAAYLICCTAQSIKLLTGGAKGVESLLSLRTAEPIKLAFLVYSPHKIEQREEPRGGKVGGTKEKGSDPSPPPVLPPARELCLAILDTKATLTVYSVQLKILFSTQLRMDEGRVTGQTFSMSSDGRVAFLPSSSFLVQAQLFPNKHYSFLQPPARLVRPSSTSIEEVEAATAVPEPSSKPASSGGWFSSLLTVAASHSSLFDTEMYPPREEEEIEAKFVKSEPTIEEDPVERSTQAKPERSTSGNASSGASSTSQSSSSSSSTQVNAAQSAVATTKQTMAQNQAMAANNLARTEELSDKAELMADHAYDFLAAARRLKEQQKSSWW